MDNMTINLLKKLEGKEKRKVMNITIGQSIEKKVSDLAKRLNNTKSETVNQILTMWLEENEKVLLELEKTTEIISTTQQTNNS